MKTYTQNGWIIPAGYALVPLSATPEMIEVAEEAHMPFGDMQTAIQCAIAVSDPVQRPDMREAFEAWMSNEGDWPQVLERSGEGYSFSVANTAWKVWQAAYGGGE